MSSYTLPAVTKLRSLPAEQVAAMLDHLFEPCVPLHTLALPSLRDRDLSSYDDVISSVRAQLTHLADSPSTSDTRWLESILSAHPRLGQKKITSGQSSAEQAQLQGSAAESERLADLNAQYERAFPGLRYVVFVNGRDRPTIMTDMQSRIERGDTERERRDAIEAMCQIAADRSGKTSIEEN